MDCPRAVKRARRGEALAVSESDPTLQADGGRVTRAPASNWIPATEDPAPSTSTTASVVVTGPTLSS